MVLKLYTIFQEKNNFSWITSSVSKKKNIKAIKNYLLDHYFILFFADYALLILWYKLIYKYLRFLCTKLRYAYLLITFKI